MTAPLVERFAAAERSQIRTIAEAAAELDGIARLDIGQPDLPVPTAVVEATARAAVNGVTGYTPTAGTPELRARIADRMSATLQETFVTTGGTNAMQLALTATARPRDTVLVPALHWPNLRAMGRALDVQLAPYSLDASLGADPEGLLAEARRLRPAAVILNSPGNPTGAVIARADLERIIAGLQQLGCWLVSDEVYEDLAYDADHVPARRVATTNVISVHSFSKSYSMTGYRLGWVCAEPAVVASLTRIQEGVVTCSSSLAQSAGIAALELGDPFLAERRMEYRRRRDLADSLLAASGLSWATPRGAFYGLVELRAGDCASGLEFATRLMRDHRVAVAPGSAFGDTVAGLVRVSLAADDDTLRQGLASLAAADEETQ